MQKPFKGTISSTNGKQIAYVKTVGKNPGIMFFGGYKSDMTGTKALALEMLCAEIGHSYVRFDYSGHGASGGTFEEGTIGTWAAEALSVFDTITEGPQILVGSSMGGWIMLIVALARIKRIHGLIGIAPAVDFTKRLLEEELSNDQLNILQTTGILALASPYSEEAYTFTHALLHEGANHILLDRPIALSCPIRLLHGVKDESVSWEVSNRLMSTVTSDDVEIRLIKNGDHRLSTNNDILRMRDTVLELI